MGGRVPECRSNGDVPYFSVCYIQPGFRVGAGFFELIVIRLCNKLVKRYKKLD